MVIDQKILDSIILSYASDTTANHPHAADDPCESCLIKQAFIASRAMQALCMSIYTTDHTLEAAGLKNPVVVILETLILGFELGVSYTNTKHMEESFNAGPKS